MKVKTFSDGTSVGFTQGSFDKWCVYFETEAGDKRVPKDADYFRSLKQMSAIYGAQKIYADFIEIYDRTGKAVNMQVLDDITEISQDYIEHTLIFEQIYSILYLTMIAEENKENTRLGKRIKRLGIHVLLVEDASVEYAARFMDGRKWREIDALCSARGF